MKRTTPKAFQQDAVESGVQIFSECKRLLDAAGDDAAGRAVAVAHHGVLLIEAPTGAGKTLIAGHLAERFSEGERVVWFWFAPFKGVTGQTAAALRAELPGLRLARVERGSQCGRQPPGRCVGDDMADGGDATEGSPERAPSRRAKPDGGGTPRRRARAGAARGRGDRRGASRLFRKGRSDTGDGVLPPLAEAGVHGARDGDAG